MLPLLFIAAALAGAALGAFAEHKRAFKVAFKAGRLVGLEEGYGDAIRDGWAQHTAAIASGVPSPSMGWSDLYDVDYCASPARDDADAAYYSLPVHDGREESGL